MLLSSVVTFWNYVFYPEATWWNLKKVETSPVFSSDHTVPLCPCMSSRCLQTCLDVSGRCYLHVSLSVLVWVFFLFSFFFSPLKPLFFYPPYVKGDLQAKLLTIQILVWPLSQLSEKNLSIVCKTTQNLLEVWLCSTLTHQIILFFFQVGKI